MIKKEIDKGFNSLAVQIIPHIEAFRIEHGQTMDLRI
jgi:hypothetical protein